MSGGIAYIYDKENKLAQRINDGMVDLDKIETQDDANEVKSMIENYVKYTGSQEANHILDNWEECKSKFIKVMPRDYKRVLNEQKTKNTEEA
jgi:glutamate synthase domain-containing protein 3